MKKWIVSACLLMMQAGAWGKITLPDIVSDNMVLQQQLKLVCGERQMRMPK